MAFYVGILDGAGDAWGVRIPDLPGCFGGGASPEAAIADATSAAREYAVHVAAGSGHLPVARTLIDILADTGCRPDVAAGESAIMVQVILDRGRSVRANISLDAGILDAIDEAASARGLTRSSFLASAAIEKLSQQATRRSTTRREMISRDGAAAASEVQQAKPVATRPAKSARRTQNTSKKVSGKHGS